MRSSVTILAALAASLLPAACGDSSSRPLEPEPWPGEVLDVAYGEHERHRIDVLPVPDAQGPCPCAVFFHSGGFDDGDKLLCRMKRREETEALAAVGIASAYVNVRRAPEFTFPDPVEDAARAVQFLKANAETYGLDPERFLYLGYSAGAVLAGTLAYGREWADPESDVPSERFSTRPIAWYDEDGPVDFRLFAPRRRIMYFGNERMQDVPMALAERASPAFLLEVSQAESWPACYLAYDYTKRKQPIYNPHSAPFGDKLLRVLVARGDERSRMVDKKDPELDRTASLVAWFQERLAEYDADA